MDENPVAAAESFIVTLAVLSWGMDKITALWQKWRNG